MDYFKHYSSAGNSKLLNHLMDEFGVSGYAYWFLLLELCSENWDGKTEPKFRFHSRLVRQKLRISSAKLEVFLSFCSGFTDLSFNIDGNEIEIHLPKLLEVKTSRQVIKSNKSQDSVYIEKEIDIDKDIDRGKQKKIKAIRSSTLGIEKLIFEQWNQVATQNGSKLPLAKALSEKRKKAISSCLAAYPEMREEKDWFNYFTKVNSTPFLLGVNDRNWRADFDWVINKENLLKVVEGRYDFLGTKTKSQMNQEAILSMRNPYEQE